MRLAAAKGKLAAEDLVWAQGMAEWQRADAIPDFEPLVRPIPVSRKESATVHPPVPSAVDAPALSAVAAPAVHTNYLARHWFGECSLAHAYWVNNVGINLLWVMAVGGVTAAGLTKDFSLRTSGLLTLTMLLAGAVLNTWSGVGVWRSAQEHTARGGRAVWAALAMLMVLGVFVRLINAGITDAPIIAQSIDLVLGRDTMPAATLRVLNRATEVEIGGGISMGTAERVKTILDATPTVRMLQLNNVGGWIQEGAKVGALVEERKLATYTARECDSACLLIFMAGDERLLGSKGRLGFHAASVAGVEGEVAKEGLEVMRASLERRGVPESFISRALATPASSIWYPTTEELVAAHVVTAVVDERAFGATGFTKWRDRQALEREFAEVPLYAAIAKATPAVYERLKADLIADIESGAPQNDMVHRTRAVIAKDVAPVVLAHGPDQPLIEFWRSHLVAAQELRSIDASDCVAYLIPAPTDKIQAADLLSAKTANTESARLTELISATADQPARSPGEAEVEPALARVARQTARLMPSAIGIITKGSRETTPPAELCTATLLFYSEILSLPPRDAGAVLRFISASN
jgi:hypothetical protein